MAESISSAKIFSKRHMQHLFHKLLTLYYKEAYNACIYYKRLCFQRIIGVPFDPGIMTLAGLLNPLNYYLRKVGI